MYSPARRRFFTGVALASAALAIYLLWPVVLHIAAQAILASGALKPSKAAPDFTLNDAKGATLEAGRLQGQGGAAEFLGDMVRTVQGGDSLVYRVPEKRIRRRVSPCSACRWMRTDGKLSTPTWQRRK